MKTIRFSKAFWITIAGVLLIAALLTFVDKSGLPFRGWIAYSILLGLAAICIYGVGKAVKASRRRHQGCLDRILLAPGDRGRPHPAAAGVRLPG